MHLALDYMLYYSSNADYVGGYNIHNRRQGVVSNFKDCKLFEYQNESGFAYTGDKTFEITVIYNNSYDKNAYFNGLSSLATRPEMGSLNYYVVDWSGSGYSVVEGWELRCKCIAVTDITAEDNSGVYAVSFKFYAPDIMWLKLYKTISVTKLSSGLAFRESSSQGWQDYFNIPLQGCYAFGWKATGLSNLTCLRVKETYVTGGLEHKLYLDKPYASFSGDFVINYPNKTITDYRGVANYCNPFIETPFAYWTIDAPESGNQNISSGEVKIYEMRGLVPWK